MKTHSQEQRNLLKKLPINETDDIPVVCLGRQFFKSITDIEFIILWNLPDVEIVLLSPESIKHVEDRVKRLGLTEHDKAGFNLNDKEDGTKN